MKLSGLVLCFLCLFIIGSSGYRILPGADTYEREARMKTVQDIGEAQDGFGQYPPARSDFMKQLINYLNSVGRK